ncbi:MAG: ABC transporter permease [Candidatus Goldiibacteriota bacterium]
MAGNFNFFVGLRYLMAKKQGFISLISFLSITGIALGVWALIVVISVMNGFHEDIRDKIVGTNAHVVVSPYIRDGIRDYDVRVKEIMKLEHVTAAAPYFMGQVMLKSGERVEGVLLWGVEPESISTVNNLSENIIKGDLRFVMKTLPGDKRGVILGREIVKNLGLDMGDEIIMISPVFTRTATGLIPKMSKMTLVGVFEAGMYDYDSTFAYASMGTVQALFKKDDVATGIAVKTDRIENSVYVANEIQRNFKDLWARDWMSMNTNLFAALKIEKVVMFIILLLIVLVAAFNIASTLIMVVMRKTKDIGILKSMGANNGDIMNIFIIQGVATGIIGSVIGYAAGILTCFYLKANPISMPGGGSIYYVDKLAVSLNFAEVTIIPFAAVAIAFLAALYPAFMASRLDPVEAVRYE